MASQRTVHVRGFGREKRDVRGGSGRGAGEKGRKHGTCVLRSFFCIHSRVIRLDDQ